MSITYDVLNKVSKQELIEWMKENVFLPSITDEQFLKDARLKFLLAKEKDLIEQDKVLNDKLEANKKEPYKFMALMVEAQKLQNKMQKVSNEIKPLLGL